MADEAPKSGKKESAKKEAKPKEDKPKKEAKPESGKKEAKPKADKKDESGKKEAKPKEDKPKGDKPKKESKPKEDKPKADKPKAASAKPKPEKPKAADKPKDVTMKPAKEKKEKPKAAPKPKPAPAPKRESKKKDKKPRPARPALPAIKAIFNKGDAVMTPESVLKKRRRDDQLKAALDKHRLSAMKALRARRKVIFKRAEKYHHQYEAAERNEIRKKRQAKNSGNLYISPEAKVVLAVRMRGIMRTHPKTTKVLQLLRLRQLNNAVFIKVNHATMTMLRLVEPYVTYGPPNLKTVQELVYKRGFGKSNRSRLPLNDNSVIAKDLGKFGIICVEDIIHELFTCGPHFKEVNNFMWPFKLNNPLGGWTDKGTHYTEGGDAGNREEDINQLVRRMN